METKDLHHVKCNSIYLNLLQIRGDREIPAPAYVREFFETSRCDSVRDFSKQRESLRTKMDAFSPGATKRILEGDETERDEKAAAQAILHYHGWHEECLAAALTGQSWVSYHAWHRAEQTMAAIGLGGIAFGLSRSAYTGMRSVYKSFADLRAANAARQAATQQGATGTAGRSVVTTKDPAKP